MSVEDKSKEEKQSKVSEPASEEKAVETASEEKVVEDTSSEEPAPKIKLSGLIGTKIGMTQTIADDGKVIPTTVIKLGPCLALEKKVKNNKISLKIGYEDCLLYTSDAADE